MNAQCEEWKKKLLSAFRWTDTLGDPHDLGPQQPLLRVSTTMCRSDRVEVFISGRPATFATAGEKPWKKCIEQQMPPATIENRETGLVLDFRLATLAPNGMPLDLDNLCEPVFSVVANRIGWFDRRRPNIHWWQATRSTNEATGCKITISELPLIALPLHAPRLSATYKGNLPTSARDSAVASWAAGMTFRRNSGIAGLALDLAFGGDLNIGDIATGRVKNFIDCLYPILGGNCGSPDDHCIETMAVQKNTPGLSRDEVRLRIWSA